MLAVDGIGAIADHPDIPGEWWVSAPITIPFFSNKALPFVIMDVAPHSGAFPKDVEEAARNFLGLTSTDRLAISSRVFSNYSRFLQLTDIDALPVSGEKDIWRFVHPKEIYICRHDQGGMDIYVQVACECDWEIEHGLQLVFRNGNLLVRVSEQDGHLTEDTEFGFQ